MYKAVSVFVFVLISVCINWGQNSVFTIKPDKPKPGDIIAVKYNSGLKEAVIKEANEIIMYAKLVQNSGAANLVEAKMEKKGDIWTASFNLEDSLAGVILFRFDSGEITDDNNQNCWFTFIYNDKGDPVQKAHNIMSMLYQYKGLNGFPIPEDKEKSNNEMELEKKLYPIQENEGNPLTKLYNSYTANSENKEIMEQILKDLIKYYQENKTRENVVIDVISLLRKIKQTVKAEEITAEYIRLYPTGKFAKQEKINDIYRENDKAKRIELVKKYFVENPAIPKELKEQLEYAFVQALIALQKFDEAYDFLSKMETQNGIMYNALAWSALEKGEKIEKATLWAKIGVDLLRNTDASAKPANMTLKDWKNKTRITLADNLDTYAYGLEKLGRNEEAEKIFEEVFDLIKSPLGVEYYVRYIECLNKNNKFDKAVDFAEKCIKQGITSDYLIKAYKAAFLKVKGNTAEFEKRMTSINAEGAKQIKEKFAKQLVNKPAPRFILKSLDGKTVDLLNLKGKIVVLDFWATWCGPCKASFPALQYVYDKYKNNENIIIFAVNTWEYEKGETREKIVKDFIKNNKYTFNVLLDPDDKAQGAITKYEVLNMPTKFVIDKDGIIQFKTVGFNSEKEMLDELDAQLEMLLNDEYKKFLKK